MSVKWIFLMCFPAALAACNKSSHKPDSGNNGITADSTYNADQFTNPILSNTTNPYVLMKDGNYYFTSDNQTFISLYNATSMAYINFAYKKTIYTPPLNAENTNNITSPELYYIDGKWYLYYSADNGIDSNHRMFVLENSSINPMDGSWQSKKLAGAPDAWAKDETLLIYNNQTYIIWVGRQPIDSFGNIIQSLYISKMSNPTTMENTPVIISSPTNLWEQYNYQQVLDGNTVSVIEAKNEAPAVIKNINGDVFLTFSANSCLTDNYTLGMMALKKAGDPLNPGDWTKYPDPVFVTDSTASAFAPGHNSFFKSIDGNEDWLIYDANNSVLQGCTDNRNIRMQKVNWNADGTPDLGSPVSINTYIQKPSGEAGK